MLYDDVVACCVYFAIYATIDAEQRENTEIEERNSMIKKRGRPRKIQSVNAADPSTEVDVKEVEVGCTSKKFTPPTYLVVKFSDGKQYRIVVSHLLYLLKQKGIEPQSAHELLIFSAQLSWLNVSDRATLIFIPPADIVSEWKTAAKFLVE